jgi:hypothetical protein
LFSVGKSMTGRVGWKHKVAGSAKVKHNAAGSTGSLRACASGACQTRYFPDPDFRGVRLLCTSTSRALYAQVVPRCSETGKISSEYAVTREESPSSQNGASPVCGNSAKWTQMGSRC